MATERQIEFIDELCDQIRKVGGDPVDAVDDTELLDEHALIGLPAPEASEVIDQLIEYRQWLRAEGKRR